MKTLKFLFTQGKLKHQYKDSYPFRLHLGLYHQAYFKIASFNQGNQLSHFLVKQNAMN